MTTPPSTDWELLESAASGDSENRKSFADRYGEMIRFSLWSRWRNRPHFASLDDAIQDVFVECFKPNGALEGARRSRGGRFRPFLQGVIHKVALRHETAADARERRAPRSLAVKLDDQLSSQPSPSRLIDRELALRVVRETGDLMAAQAANKSAAAVLRVRILRLRFEDDLPIREIARVVAREPDYVHHQYAKARAEFRRLLRDVVARHLPGTRDAVENACRQLLDLLR